VGDHHVETLQVGGEPGSEGRAVAIAALRRPDGVDGKVVAAKEGGIGHVEALQVGGEPGPEGRAVAVATFRRPDGMDGKVVAAQESGIGRIKAYDLVVHIESRQRGDHVADGLCNAALSGVHAGDDVEDFH